MEIVNARVIVPYIDGISIMKNIEKAGRTCYKSEVLSDESYKKFIKSIIARGHESVLEHEKVSVRLVTDRGTMWDITRHRHCSFSIESSRYCNYSKDKFGNEIKVIDPFFLKPEVDDENGEHWATYTAWKNSIAASEKAYFEILNNGGIPDHARMVLPASLATEICMTANIREWRHIFKLRCQHTVHPHVRQVMIPLLLHFKDIMPELFEDITYDEEFASKYKNSLAKIEVEMSDFQINLVDDLYEESCECTLDDDDYANGYHSGRLSTLNKIAEDVFYKSDTEKLIEDFINKFTGQG